MKNEDKCCGTCKYHKPDDDFPEDWICCNDKSENVADWTDFEDVCDQYEEKAQKRTMGTYKFNLEKSIENALNERRIKK